MKPSLTLGYNILSCSSESSAHPISTIQNASLKSEGWQSQPNPKFPIDILIDLTTSVELETIQFVSHQNKIPNRIDIYVADHDQNFQALGSFQFSDNSHTNYEARELKSATITGVKAQYVKLSIPGCLPNPSNAQNQVGLISFNLIGRGGIPKKAVSNPSRITNESAKLLDDLERQKRDAVAREDFKEAESLKQRIDHLRRAYDQVAQLQRQKDEAVSQENYLEAERLKSQIEFLLTGGQPQEFSKPVEFRQANPQPQPQPIPQRKVESPPRPIRRKEPSPPPPEPDSPPPKRSTSPPPQPQRAKPKPKREPAPTAETYVPKKTPPRSSRPPPGDHELAKDPDELTPEARSEAGLLIDLFGEKAVSCFYSHAWNLKVDGINELAKLIGGLKEQQVNAFNRFLYMLRHPMQEARKTVISAAYDAIQKLTEKLKISNQDLNRALSPLVAQIQSKVGCAQQPLSDCTCAFVEWMASKDLWEPVLQILLTVVSNPGKWKVSLAQVQTLQKIFVTRQEIPNVPGLGLKPLMAFVLPCLESPRNEVREAAMELTVIIEFKFGSSIQQYLDKLPKRTADAVRKKIEAYQDDQ